MIRILSIFLILFFVGCANHPRGQYLPSQLDNNKTIESEILDNDDAASAMLSDESHQIKFDEDLTDETYSLADSVKSKKSEYKDYEIKDGKQHNKNERLKGFPSHLPDEYGDEKRTIKTLDVLEKYYGQARSQYSLTYYRDQYDYNDPTGVYQRTFVTNKDSARLGALLLNYEYMFFRSMVLDLAMGGAMGMGYSTGHGQFAGDQTASDARFNLFYFPIDLYFGVGIPLGNWFKAQAMVGHSGLLLVQNRNDFDYEEKGKNVRQFGHGNFVAFKGQISLSRLWKNVGLLFVNQYDVSQVYLDLTLRRESYNDFQQDLSISGFSYGFGFTFEML